MKQMAIMYSLPQDGTATEHRKSPHTGKVSGFYGVKSCIPLGSKITSLFHFNTTGNWVKMPDTVR